MKTNMGSLDRMVRMIIAVMLGLSAFMGMITGTWAIVVYVVTAIFLLTSLVGTCPLYSVFGINTCSLKKE
jgi:K+-transporting ATPase A subunit